MAKYCFENVFTIIINEYLIPGWFFYKPIYPRSYNNFSGEKVSRVERVEQPFLCAKRLWRRAGGGGDWRLRWLLCALPLHCRKSSREEPLWHLSLPLLLGQWLAVMSEELRLNAEPAHSCHSPLRHWRTWRTEMNGSNDSSSVVFAHRPGVTLWNPFHLDMRWLRPQGESPLPW